nr:MAG TPA: hypothetical protein [Caudoviricetes sp.]
MALSIMYSYKIRVIYNHLFILRKIKCAIK